MLEGVGTDGHQIHPVAEGLETGQSQVLARVEHKWSPNILSLLGEGWMRGCCGCGETLVQQGQGRRWGPGQGSAAKPRSFVGRGLYLC